MRVFILNRTLLIFVCLALCWSNAPAQNGTDAVLTNNAIVKLVKASFKEKNNYRNHWIACYQV